MPRCPHCGELYRRGQEKCYACGQPVTGRGSGGEGRISPLLYIIGGGIVAVIVLGVILATGNRAAVAREDRARLEEQRVRDSVRQSNIDRRTELRKTRREEGVEADIADLELRLDRIVARADRRQLNPEQTALVADIDGRISNLKALLISMAERADVDQEVIADSVKAGASEIRELLTQLGRRRRPGDADPR